MVNTMMDVFKNNLVVIFSISVVGVITFIVFNGYILGGSSTYTAEQKELLARFVELSNIFDKKNTKTFEHLESIEQSAILDELISILEKLGINNIDKLNLLKKKKEELADTMESLKRVCDDLLNIEGTKDHCLSRLQDLTGMSLQEVMELNLPSSPPQDITENLILSLWQNYQNNKIKGQNYDIIWENLYDLKDSLNTDISNLVFDILKELV